MEYKWAAFHYLCINSTKSHLSTVDMRLKFDKSYNYEYHAVRVVN